MGEDLPAALGVFTQLGAVFGARRHRTIINTCKRAGVDPLAYATDVITKLQRGWPKSRIEELLPDPWSPSDVELAAE